jgi:hypothetical protein
MNRIAPPKSTMWAGTEQKPRCINAYIMDRYKRDLNVAMKGGSVSVNHAHMDIGSFVMDADGVRWAMDFGMQDYESLESKGIQPFSGEHRTHNAGRFFV